MHGKKDIDLLIRSSKRHWLKCLLSLGYYSVSKFIIAKLFFFCGNEIIFVLFYHTMVFYNGAGRRAAQGEVEKRQISMPYMQENSVQSTSK